VNPLAKKRTIPQNQRKLVTKVNPKSPVSEQYRTIRTNIQFSTVDTDIRSIMVTSSVPGDGKSTTAANLAVVFAQQGKKVLIVDADLRKPTAHYTFNVPNTIGLTNVVTKQIGLKDAIRETTTENLFILTSGPIPPNPAEMLGSKAMKDLIKEMYTHFDMVVFDTPPVLAVTDAQILANQCDGTVLVVKSEQTDKEAALKAKELLTAASGKLLGVVLNGVKPGTGNYYYYYTS